MWTCPWDCPLAVLLSPVSHLVQVGMQAEHTVGPDTEHAREFLDELLGDLNTHHRIAAKQIMRGWITSGVPQPALVQRPFDRQRNQEVENGNVIFLSPVPSISKG